MVNIGLAKKQGSNMLEKHTGIKIGFNFLHSTGRYLWIARKDFFKVRDNLFHNNNHGIYLYKHIKYKKWEDYLTFVELFVSDSTIFLFLPLLRTLLAYALPMIRCLFSSSQSLYFFMCFVSRVETLPEERKLYRFFDILFSSCQNNKDNLYKNYHNKLQKVLCNNYNTTK